MADFRFKSGDLVVAKESFTYQSAGIKEGAVFKIKAIDPHYKNETILVRSLDGTFAHWFDDKHFDHFNPSCEELEDMFADFE